MTKVKRTRSQFLEPYSNMSSRLIWLLKGDSPTAGVSIHELYPQSQTDQQQFKWSITVMTKECILLFVVFPLQYFTSFLKITQYSVYRTVEGWEKYNVLLFKPYIYIYISKRQEIPGDPAVLVMLCAKHHLIASSLRHQEVSKVQLLNLLPFVPPQQSVLSVLPHFLPTCLSLRTPFMTFMSSSAL